jgi:hypothetical protein
LLPKKREGPAGCEPAKHKTEQKALSIDSSISKGKKDDDFEPEGKV